MTPDQEQTHETYYLQFTPLHPSERADVPLDAQWEARVQPSRDAYTARFKGVMERWAPYGVEDLGPVISGDETFDEKSLHDLRKVRVPVAALRDNRMMVSREIASLVGPITEEYEAEMAKYRTPAAKTARPETNGHVNGHVPKYQPQHVKTGTTKEFAVI